MTIEQVVALLKALHEGAAVYAYTGNQEYGDDGFEPIDALTVTVHQDSIYVEAELDGETYEVDEDTVTADMKALYVARAKKLQEKANALFKQVEEAE